MLMTCIIHKTKICPLDIHDIKIDIIIIQNGSDLDSFDSILEIDFILPSAT